MISGTGLDAVYPVRCGLRWFSSMDLSTRPWALKKPLALRLQQEGFRVVVPAIPFQAAEYWAFTRGRFTVADYTAWLDKVIQNEVHLSSEKPFLVGFSMGGTLATIATAQSKVAGTVLLAPYNGLAYSAHNCLGKRPDGYAGLSRWCRPYWVALSMTPMDGGATAPVRC